MQRICVENHDQGRPRNPRSRNCGFRIYNQQTSKTVTPTGDERKICLTNLLQRILTASIKGRELGSFKAINGVRGTH
jgi:hypothetical protein